MLDALVLADGPAEDDAIPCIAAGELDGPLADAHGFRAHQDALRIEPVQQILEALALLADTIVEGNRQAVDEDLVGIHRRTAHFLDFPHLHVVAVEIGIKERQAPSMSGGLVMGRGAGQQQNLVGAACSAGPDLFAVYDIAIAGLLGHGADAAGIQPGIRLGDTEADRGMPGDDVREPALLLLGRAEDDYRVRPE